MNRKGSAYVFVISLTAGLGGFLFGFDTAVISGAINFLRVQFHLDAVSEGWIMSSALAGCVAGAAIAGYLADRHGRKMVLLLSAFLFMISAVGCALAATPAFLVIARITGGIGVGFAAMVAPMFISEVAPAAVRGRLVSLYQLAITMGIFVSYLSNAGILHYAAHHAAVAAISPAAGPVLSPAAALAGGGRGFLQYFLAGESWRGMLGSNIIPAALFFILLLFVPESPRWLIKENRIGDAQRILDRINGAELGAKEAGIIRRAMEEESTGFRQLWAPGIRTALVVGLVLPFFTQLTGITTVMYYAPAIFEKAGLGADSAMSSATVIGFFNMLFTFLAIWKIDRWGRKPLLIGGFIGLGIALFLIGALFGMAGKPSPLLLGAFIFYIAVFAATIGPGVWVVLSEIYPTSIRGRAMSLGTLSLFLGSSFVTQTYPLLRDFLGIGWTFALYGFMMLPAAWFVKKMVPETKGKTLEDIGRHWMGKEADTSVKRKTSIQDSLN